MNQSKRGKRSFCFRQLTISDKVAAAVRTNLYLHLQSTDKNAVFFCASKNLEDISKTNVSETLESP
jgi:hypothetical protein